MQRRRSRPIELQDFHSVGQCIHFYVAVHDVQQRTASKKKVGIGGQVIQDYEDLARTLGL